MTYEEACLWCMDHGVEVVIDTRTPPLYSIAISYRGLKLKDRVPLSRWSEWPSVFVRLTEALIRQLEGGVSGTIAVQLPPALLGLARNDSKAG